MRARKCRRKGACAFLSPSFPCASSFRWPTFATSKASRPILCRPSPIPQLSCLYLGSKPLPRRPALLPVPLARDSPPCTPPRPLSAFFAACRSCCGPFTRTPSARRSGPRERRRPPRPPPRFTPPRTPSFRGRPSKGRAAWERRPGPGKSAAPGHERRWRSAATLATDLARCGAGPRDSLCSRRPAQPAWLLAQESQPAETFPDRARVARPAAFAGEPRRPRVRDAADAAHTCGRNGPKGQVSLNPRGGSRPDVFGARFRPLRPAPAA